MLTKGDLHAIAETLRPLIKAEGEIISKQIKDYVDSNNKVLGQIIRIELAAQKQEIMEAVRAGFYEVGKIIRELKEEILEERIKQLEERVKQLEKQQIHRTPK